MRVSLSNVKKERIKSLAVEILETDYFPIRLLAKFIGVLVSSLPAVNYGELFYRFLEMDKIKALRNSRGEFDGLMFLSPESKKEISWWLENIDDSFKPIRIPGPQHVLTTDSSKLGWGADFKNQQTGGRWSILETEKHINILELQAVLFGLKAFCKDLSNTHIRIRVDNTTAVAYINNLGGVKSESCHQVAKAIWIWAIEREIFLSAEFLPGW